MSEQVGLYSNNTVFTKEDPPTLADQIKIHVITGSCVCVCVFRINSHKEFTFRNAVELQAGMMQVEASEKQAKRAEKKLTEIYLHHMEG